MEPATLIASLKEKVNALSAQASNLSTNLLDTDDDCINNLKAELDSAIEDLNTGIEALSTYASTITNSKKW